MVESARFRLACLWISQVARVFADWCLRMFVIQEVARSRPDANHFAWHLVAAIYIAPFVLLSPLNGALCNELPKRWVLVGAAGYCTSIALLFGAILEPDSAWWLWCVCLGLTALGAAVYSPTRYALLPAAAQDGRLPLTRVNGLIEMGGTSAIVAGMIAGLFLDGWYRAQPSGSALVLILGIPAALNLLALLTALPVSFPSDVRREESASQAVAGFFRDSSRILRNRASCGALLGLAGFFGLVAAGSGAVVAHVMGENPTGGNDALLRALIFVTAGAALGSLLAALQGHPRRSLGLIPMACTGLLIVLAWAAMRGDLHWLPCLLLGMMGGLANVPLRAAYQASVPADARGNGMAVMNAGIFTATTLLALLMTGLASSRVLDTPLAQLLFLSILAGVGAFISWYVLLLPWIELFSELLVLPFWRVRGCSPGLDHFPRDGPVIVISNHTSLADPLWIIKVLPRRLFPMMTSVFYDLPGIRALMKFAGVIRVPASPFKREAPELDEAAAILDRGGCVLLFPEGWMKRDEKQLMRFFGQGIWHLLRRRPETPIVACWIEGGWGSFTSHKNGPPFRKKPIDLLRRIEVAVRAPEVIPKSILDDPRATRAYLMNACLEARSLLGLAPPEESADAAEREEQDEAAGERR